MKFEYLLFNLAVLLGPLAMSFEKQIHFVRRWRHAFAAIFIVAVPFWIWDALATGRHWRFNEKYTLGLQIAGLPLEELLFFITVPFAALFVWETINFYVAPRPSDGLQYFGFVLCLSPLRGIFFLISGQEYTGMVFIALGAAAILDWVLHTGLFAQRNLLVYLGALAFFILLFNGYLTARPVVLYDEQYQLGWRVGTIPIEDFGYGFALILLVTLVYEKLKKRGHA